LLNGRSNSEKSQLREDAAKRRDISGKKLSIKVAQTGLGPGKTMCQERWRRAASGKIWPRESGLREEVAQRRKAHSSFCP
jgi:hypothetical protein